METYDSTLPRFNQRQADLRSLLQAGGEPRSPTRDTGLRGAMGCMGLTMACRQTHAHERAPALRRRPLTLSHTRKESP